MTLEEKQHAIDKICDLQRSLIKDAAKLATTDVYGAFALCLRARSMEVEKVIIAMQPIPKYAKYHKGCGVVGGNIGGVICDEKIIMPDGAIIQARSTDTLGGGEPLNTNS